MYHATLRRGGIQMGPRRWRYVEYLYQYAVWPFFFFFLLIAVDPRLAGWLAGRGRQDPGRYLFHLTSCLVLSCTLVTPREGKRKEAGKKKKEKKEKKKKRGSLNKRMSERVNECSNTSVSKVK